MIQINTVDLSEFQNPKEVDYQAMKDAGIKNLIIRGSVDLRLDHHAAEHIANAKKYGFNWHLYHYFYNDTNEADFAVKAAKSLGLGKDQILFLDMEDKSLPENWDEQFSIFRKAVGNSFKVGLYCSDSPYNAKFSDNQLKQLGVIRWIASYSYEPKNYDVWQKSGAGSGGFGTYTKDIDRDVDPNNILAISSSKPYVPTSEDKMVRQIILQPGYDTETGIYGLGCSYDNGKTFKVYWTIFGRKYYQEDADRLWPFLKNKIGDIKNGSLNVTWNDIQNKPDFALKSQLPAPVDLTGYAKIDDIPQSMTWSQITGKPNVATKDDVDYLKTLIGSSSGSGDAGLTVEAIVELIKYHFKAEVDINSGNLLIDVDGVSNGSIADAVATKVAQSLQLKLQGSDLVAEIGGTE